MTCFPLLLRKLQCNDNLLKKVQRIKMSHMNPQTARNAVCAARETGPMYPDMNKKAVKRMWIP